MRESMGERRSPCPGCKPYGEAVGLFLFIGSFRIPHQKKGNFVNVAMAYVGECSQCGYIKYFTSGGDYIHSVDTSQLPSELRSRMGLGSVGEKENATGISPVKWPSTRYATFDSLQIAAGSKSFTSGRPYSGSVGSRSPSRSASDGTGTEKSNSPKSLHDFLNQTSDLNTYEKGLRFEQFCLRLLEKMGYEVEHTGQRGDRGVDLKAVRQEPIGSQTLIVQCKYQESVSADVIIQTLGMVSAANANQGLVITTGSFTADAIKFSEENLTIEIIDGSKLAELVGQYVS